MKKVIQSLKRLLHVPNFLQELQQQLSMFHSNLQLEQQQFARELSNLQREQQQLAKELSNLQREQQQGYQAVLEKRNKEIKESQLEIQHQILEQLQKSYQDLQQTLSRLSSDQKEEQQEMLDCIHNSVQKLTQENQRNSADLLQDLQISGLLSKEEISSPANLREWNQEKNFPPVLKELFRNMILCRWQTVDAMDSLRYPEDYPVTCPICRHQEAQKNYSTRISSCIFGGGLLKRFICPECGAVFGPLKILEMSPLQLSEEYRQSYKVYSESDCTFLEEDVFHSMKPEKGKCYLNWGAGAWNKTTEKLRAEGYTVYDYEPFAPASARDSLFTDIQQFRDLKFDGIFSNDLIEHLQDPVEALLEMKSFLTSDGQMAHGSGCYEYEFVYTRFHLCFFLGESLKRLSSQIGMNYVLSDRCYPQASSFRICRFTQNQEN